MFRADLFKLCFLADDRVFLLFHRNLSDALTQLALAIYAVLSRKFQFPSLLRTYPKQFPI